MSRIHTATLLLLSSLATGTATIAAAQGPSQIPVGEDLRRLDRTEQRIESGPDRRRSVPLDRNVSPTNPSGVPGFDGPPGTVGDSVGSYGALPPGASGNDNR